MSKNEKTANDSYLIVKGEEKEMKKLKKWYSNGIVNAKINLIEN